MFGAARRQRRGFLYMLVWGVKPHGVRHVGETHMFSIHMIFSDTYIYARECRASFGPVIRLPSLLAFRSSHARALTQLHSGSRCVRKIIMHGV